MHRIPSTIYTILTLVSLLALGGVTIHLLDNFGELIRDGDMEIDGNTLGGSTPDLLHGLSISVLVLAIIYVAYFSREWYKADHESMSDKQRRFWVTVLISMIVGITVASMNLRLVEDFGHSDLSLEYDPPHPQPGDDYKLRGHYAMGLYGAAITMIVLSGGSLAWFAYELLNDRNHVVVI